MKPKILIIPTYFPTKTLAIVGSQIQEQTELLADIFDIKVLYSLPGMGWKRFLLYQIIFLITGKKKFLSCKIGLLSGSSDTRGYYFFQNHFFSDKVNFKLQLNAHIHLVEELKKENWIPELIHARGFEQGGMIANQLKIKYNIPYVLTENVAFIFDDSFTLTKLKYYKQVINDADKLLFVSSFLMKLTLMHGIGQNSDVEIIGNMINENIFYPALHKEKGSVFQIFTTGYYSFIKDFPTLFKAIHYLIENGHADIRLIVGVTYTWSASQKNDLLELAKEYQILDYCKFEYQIPRDKIAEYYRQSDVYVSTSIIETFGIASLEAMFCGIPVISTLNGGIDDFGSDNNCIKVNLRDYVAIAKAIIQIKNKEVTFNSTKIHSSVLNKFGTRSFHAHLSSIYNSTIENFSHTKSL